MLVKVTRKRLRDVLLTEKHKLELEIKNQPQPKPKDAVEEEKSSLGGYTVKINNYGRFTFLNAFYSLGISLKRSLGGISVSYRYHLVLLRSSHKC